MFITPLPINLLRIDCPGCLSVRAETGVCTCCVLLADYQVVSTEMDISGKSGSMFFKEVQEPRISPCNYKFYKFVLVNGECAPSFIP